MKKVTGIISLFLIFPIIGFLLFILLNLYQLIHKKISPPKYNLILISIDTLRSDHMGVYGYGKKTTPNIDKFARDAYIFSDAHTVVPQTYPSFAALLTGLHPFTSGIRSNGLETLSLPLSDNVNTLTKILKNNNYHTGAFVNSSVMEPLVSNMNKGFDTYKLMEYRTFNDANYSMITREANSWLSKNINNKFYLWVHLIGPHDPYNPTDKNKCVINNIYCSGLQNISNEEVEKKREKLQYCQQNGVSGEDINLMQDMYDAKVRDTDEQVGQILDNISDLKLENNTIIVIYGDHGEGFDHNYYFEHGNVLYNSAINIPLIIKYPKSLSNQKNIKIFIDNTDILPTILDLLHIKIKDNVFSGFSFANEISKDISSYYSSKKIRKESFIVNSEFTKFGIYDGRYKYIYSEDNSCKYNGQREELYDTVIDKNEIDNLVFTQKEIAGNMKSKLLLELSKYNLPPFNFQKNKDRDKELDAIKNRIKSLGY